MIAADKSIDLGTLPNEVVSDGTGATIRVRKKVGMDPALSVRTSVLYVWIGIIDRSWDNLVVKVVFINQLFKLQDVSCRIVADIGHLNIVYAG